MPKEDARLAAVLKAVNQHTADQVALAQESATADLNSMARKLEIQRLEDREDAARRHDALMSLARPG